MGSKKTKCPSCQKTTKVQDEFFPFCSRRCRLLDLGQWLSGDYRIPDKTTYPSRAETEEEKE